MANVEVWSVEVVRHMIRLHISKLWWMAGGVAFLRVVVNGAWRVMISSSG